MDKNVLTLKEFHNMNETTKRIGNTRLHNAVGDSPKHNKELRELLDAVKVYPDFDTIWLSFYTLGALHGKETERKRIQKRDADRKRLQSN